MSLNIVEYNKTERAIAENMVTTHQEEHLVKPGKPLHQIFEDTISRSNELSTPPPSLWDQILSWFWGSEKETISPTTPSKTAQDLSISTKQTLSPIPVLDPPSLIPDDCKNIELMGKSTTSKKNKHGIRDIEDLFSSMNEQTIESIMHVVFQTQIRLEKHHAQTAEKTFSKHLDFQKQQQKVLSEIKDILMNDTVIAERLGTVQNVVYVANFIAGVATVASTYGLLGPLWGFFSTATAASLTITNLGGKSYFEHQMKEHRAHHETHQHNHHYSDGKTEESRDRLMNSAEADAVFKERWAQLLKRSDKMRKLILKK